MSASRSSTAWTLARLATTHPTLDNLLKATIDALDQVLGLRRGKFARPQVDDERIDRIVASKRVAQPGETPGARVVIVEL